MAELTINWETLPQIPQPEKKDAPVITSEAPSASAPDVPAAPAPETKLTADKPYFIYVTDGASPTGFDTVEKVILDDDRVKLGSHAFHAVKMTPDSAKADPLLTEKGGKEPVRFIFVTADLKTIKPLEGGSLKLGEVWSTMKATANKFYKQDLDATVRDLKNVLNEFDKIAKERTVVDDKEKRATDKGLTEIDRKEIAAKRAELDARQKKAEEAKNKLWELRPKGDSAAPKSDAKPA
jgi:hypothetical protein